MPQYIKKPKVITAEQYDGTEESANKIKAIAPDFVTILISHFQEKDNISLNIRTLNGLTYVKKGDWILFDEEDKDIWPCDGGMFEKNYELVKDCPINSYCTICGNELDEDEPIQGCHFCGEV